jgi:DnaJ-domain-containing protein 1
MGIADRLAEVLKSYLTSTSGTKTAGRSGAFADPDLQDAWEELDEFLGTKRAGAFSSENAKAEQKSAGGAKPRETKLPPEALRPDYACLGVPFGAPPDVCKAAWKTLLKTHHPDRHAGHEGNMRKATEKSARINAAWERIERWARDGG